MSVVSFVAAVALMLVLRRTWRTEHRRLRNGVLITAIAWLFIVAFVELTAEFVPRLQPLLGGVMLLVPASVLVLGGFLVANGFTMARREARTLGNLLSLLLGVAIWSLPVLVVLLVVHLTPWSVGLAVFVCCISAYFGAAFVVFLVFSAVYARTVGGAGVDAIIILGSGLIGDRVPPLLAGRLDRAIALRAAAERPDAVVMVPSGGKGADERLAEGEAMARYLVDAGVPADAIIPETQARNTLENLRLSNAILCKEHHDRSVLIVTSDYHALRAALLARQEGLAADALGARTARYFVPSAFVREFIAIVRMRLVFTLVAMGASTVVAVLAGLIVAAAQSG